PDTIARDYVTINHNRSKSEFVMLMWFVPQMVQPEAKSPPLTAMLEKYVVILIIHGHFNPNTGAMSFDEINHLEARDGSEKLLRPVDRSTLPPISTGMLAAMETLFRQSFGAMGNGMRTFLFDTGTVHSCNQGRLSVLYAGETYTWETPIPSCTQN